MDTGGSQGNHHIPGFHGVVVNDFGLVHHTGAVAGQVIVVLCHHARVFCRLAANQGAAGTDTALCNAAHNVSNLLGDIFAAGNIIQEEQRLGAAADDVIDAHGNTVDANGIMLVKKHGNFQLCSHPVGAGYQHRLRNAFQIQAKAAAEASHIIQAALVSGALNMLFHQFYGLVAGGNVNTGSSVALGITFLHGRLSSFNHYSLPFQQ